MQRDKRPPVYLDLLRIRQPVTAIVSIGHRLSGVFLVLCIPFFIWLLARSLGSADGFADVAALMASGVFKAFALVATWALAHHLLAGVRLLLIDIRVGTERDTAKRTARGVLIAEVVIVLAAAVCLVSA